MSAALLPERPRVGLALGGGAARGLAHLGVLEALEAEGVPVDLVAGTSFGAMVGGVYCHERKIAPLIARTRAFLASDEYRRLTVHVFRADGAATASFLDGAWRSLRRGLAVGGGLNRLSIVSEPEFRKVIEALIPDVSLEELQLPFAATAVDLISCEEVVFTSGSLRKACMASSAIPGLFPPLSRGPSLLVDGSWADCVPVGPAKDLGADLVIAVDVAPDLEDPEEPRRGFEIAWRANSVTRTILKKLQLKAADVVIRPAVEKIHWADFSKLEDARVLGREAAYAALPSILALIKKAKDARPKKRAWWRRG